MTRDKYIWLNNDVNKIPNPLIEQHNNCINKIFYEHEAQLKSKKEEIERLKEQLSSVHNLMYCNGYSDAIDCYDTFGNFNTKHKPNSKARSIVAMLFWECKKSEREAKI